MEKRKNRKSPKRILSWIVCFSMAFSVLTVIPGGTMKVQAASADGAKIVAVAQSYMGKEQSVGHCLGFCRLVYREADYNTAQDPNGCGSACAYHSWTVSSHLGSTSKDNIPLGALVFFSGASSQSVLSCGARPGHVGIYAGDGYIINARGTVTNGTNISKDKISLWESWGYAFLGWRPISGYTLDSGGSADQSFISYMERPASGGNYSGSIQILGYALHKNGIKNVTAWVNGQVMDCPMYNSPDVAKVYPGYPTGNEGFQAQIPISYLKEGENEIDIYAYERDDTPHLIASHKFNWSSFVGKLESPVQNGSYDGTLSIQGYALHKNGIKNVTAWVNGQVMDCPMYGRPEIATEYSGYPTGNEGFQTQISISCLKEGENEIDIYAYERDDTPHLIASHKFNWNSFIGKIESPVQNGSYDGILSIQGYALHKNGIRNVTAWVNGQVMDCPMYERPEIATKYSGYPTGNEGFKTEIPISCLKNGENEISVFAYESNDWPHNIVSYKFNYVIDEKKEEHVHAYTDAWKSDAESHWKECECGEKSENTAHQFSWVIDRAATEDSTGLKHEECETCGYERSMGTIIEKLNAVCDHAYKTIITLATTQANGSIVEKCSKCGDEKSKSIIYAAGNASLSKTSYVYNGKTQKTSVTVKDSRGKALKNNVDYTVSFPKGMKNVGRYTVTVVLKGNYSGTISETFDIVPKGTSISKVTAKKKGFAVKWKKQKKQTTGYEIAYSTSSKFAKKSTKIINAGKGGATSKAVLKLKVKKKYYVRIRTYKTVKINGKSVKLYSDWSKAKAVTTKK